MSLFLILILVILLVGCAKKAEPIGTSGKTTSGQTAIDQDVNELEDVDKDLGDSNLEEVEKDLDFGF